jgi:2-amino-4-hydroxy-6-hydroxymethyldihydropteridine diphosphokinase
MHRRAFVLQPLLEIAPDCVIPSVGKASVAAQACLEQDLRRLQEQEYVA